MPRIAPKICALPGCYRTATHPDKYCESHKQQEYKWKNKGSNWGNKSRHERGYGWKWEKIRKFVLKRDMHLCQVCLAEGKYTPANQVDHIKPKAKGGNDDANNLQSICKQCHGVKTALESK